MHTLVIILILVAVIIGLGVATVNDVDVNYAGTVFAALSSITYRFCSDFHQLVTERLVVRCSSAALPLLLPNHN